MFNIPWPRESLSVHGFQVVAALSRVVDDSVWSFPCGVELSLGGISGCRGNLAQNEISYVKSFELYPFIVAVGHFLLILRHSDGSIFSYFVQAIQVDSQVVVIAFFVEHLLPDASYSYLNQDHGFSSICEPEGGFSCRVSCCGPVSPQDIG